MNGRRKVRLGLLGAGAWGRNLLRNFDRLGALAAFASVRPASRAAVAERYPGIEIYEDPEKLFAAGDLDGTVIATPAATHGRLAAQALEAGKHVFVEKPLSLDLAEGEALRALAARRGLTLMVDHQLRYHPAFRALTERVGAGTIGPLRYIHSHRLGPRRPGLEESALWGLAPHDVSLLLALSGTMPQRVTATGAPDSAKPHGQDSLVASLGFADRLSAHLFVSFLHPFKERRLVAVGEAGALVFDDIATGAAKLQLHRRPADGRGAEGRPSRATVEAVPYDADEPLRLACAAFLAAVRSERRPLSDADEAVRVLRVLDACQRSLASGAPVDVKSG